MSARYSYTRFLPSHSLLFAPDRFDRDLVRDFLFAFSRAEYALKWAGFVRGGRWGELKIEWSRFAEDIAPQLSASSDDQVSKARQYLTENPPKREALSASGLKWQRRVRRADQSDAQFLIESVTQVRNNLFHGGKELMGLLAERDRQLVDSALTMVVFAVSVHGRVAAIFQEAGPSVAA